MVVATARAERRSRNSAGQTAANAPWSELAEDIEGLFQFELLPPEFSESHPYIVAEYRPTVASAKKQRGPRLDIANAGSGFHQVLLLLSFFYRSDRAASIVRTLPRSFASEQSHIRTSAGIHPFARRASRASTVSAP